MTFLKGSVNIIINPTQDYSVKHLGKSYIVLMEQGAGSGVIPKVISVELSKFEVVDEDIKTQLSLAAVHAKAVEVTIDDSDHVTGVTIGGHTV